MAAELERELGATTELVASGGGVFEIDANGEPVFSKRELGRFPEDGEIVRRIRSGGKP